MLLKVLSTLTGYERVHSQDQRVSAAVFGRALVLVLVFAGLAALWWYGLTVESDYPASAT